ncbi:mycocerosic acid synthase-like polyketide synthase [Synchiropus splendidus]|uniref:mycocerosic acid synthase-like polyketide synthase n=1 Tax=Synchiropus splendidus TaxID=270530 RepID=UPI00237E695C|nr:mycocerosic acid synthase-like polyketide synthase [Synchiropus splendidus]
MEATDEAVAVIGMGCNFPGGEGLENFWKVLLEGRNCAVDIPADRFHVASWFDPDEGKPGKTQTTRAALIDGFNEFDHRFFGISEAEAEFMDPQQKLLLQCSFRALEDAGVPLEDISGTRTGVYIGLMNKDYEMIRSNCPTTMNHYSGTGTAMSIAANRISFTFNLTGPSFAIDSACSSSLVALHVARQAITQGECDMALCGGVSCIIEPRVFVALSKAKMISPDGTSKPFSDKADGYGRGEGCGVVLLKPLEKAKQDGNKIWGVISKTAINQDGHSVSPITKPSRTQQEELLRGIYTDIDPAHVQYVEAHGTGTPIGDLTEAASISNVIAKTRPPGSEALCIGSVKGNIGHTESAAGVAGLIKVLLMMKHQAFVSSVLYSQGASSVDPKSLGLNVLSKVERWNTSGSACRVAGINSFGFGGTNAHAVVREFRQVEAPQMRPKILPNLFVLSAASEKSLVKSLSDTSQRLSDCRTSDLEALCFTSACARSHQKHKYRKVLLVSTVSDLLDHVKSESSCTSPVGNTEVVFVFSGNGVAYRGMCRQLFREFPVFRVKVKEVEALFRKHKRTHLSEMFDDSECDLGKPGVVQPLLFAIQVAIVALLKEWGVTPDVVLGHSLGEVAAAHCSGLLSLEDAVKVVHHRSALQSTVTGGKMLAVGNVAVAKVVEVLEEFSGKICVAAVNSPQSCTLSGERDAVDAIRDTLKKSFVGENIFLCDLSVSSAYHSHLMDPVMDDVRSRIQRLDVHDKHCKLFSTVSGAEGLDEDFTTGEYWAKNIREPVLFEQTLRALSQNNKKSKVFVEIGPRRALQKNIQETLGHDALVLPSVQPETELETVLTTVGKLFELGVNVCWRKIYQDRTTLRTDFPIYHFDNTKKRLFFEAIRRGDEPPSRCQHVLLSQTKGESGEYVCNLSAQALLYLQEHKYDSMSIVPGAFYVELAFSSLLAHLKTKVSSLQLSLSFQNLLTISSNNQLLKVTLSERDSTFKIQSSVATHATGTYQHAEPRPLFEESDIAINVVMKRCNVTIKKLEIYRILSQAGFHYGSVFKRLEDVHYGHELKEAVTSISVPYGLVPQSYSVHPVLLDCFLQMSAVVALGCLTAKPGFPSQIGSIIVSGPLHEEMVLYLRSTRECPDFLEVCGCFATKDGKVTVELRDVRISFLGQSNIDSLFFHNNMVPVYNETTPSLKLKALVFEDSLGIAGALKPLLHRESKFVTAPETNRLSDIVKLTVSHNMTDVLFIWGVEDLSHLSSERIFQCLLKCCEQFRQVVLALKHARHSVALRVITLKSSETSVDHISCGFVLSGMMRACAAEVPELSFQLLDLGSTTREDIEALARAMSSCKQEVTISRGKSSAAMIAHTTTVASTRRDIPLMPLKDFDLQTASPYIAKQLTAVARGEIQNIVPDNSVQVQLTKLCVHSSDYFAITLSQVSHGKSLYWDRQSHPLLALDFCGIVTAVGKNVNHLRVGDQVVSCYPTAARDTVTIPHSVCSPTARFTFLSQFPCVSFFILAWKIMQETLPKVQQSRKMAIISSNVASVLTKVLALTAIRSGWNVTCLPHFREDVVRVDRCHALVCLPPCDDSWKDALVNDGIQRDVVVLRSSFMTPADDTFLPKTDFLRVHMLDVANILQPANLRAQNRKVFDWISSLGFDDLTLPLKAETFQVTNAADAQINPESYFTSKTLRQVVLEHRAAGCPPSYIPFLDQRSQLFRKNCVYIVTGGLTGLGLETVKFIAHNGGGRIVTLSRRSLTDDMQLEMELLQKRCCVEIANIRCDVSVSSQVTESIMKVEQVFQSCPIKGVFHSAAVLHDGLIENLDEALFRKVLHPKVGGALNLHFATLHKKLDFFVCYSSISSFIGNASQCNYAAANSFLDMFCHYRRNHGLAGQSINWGPLNLGLLLDKDHFQKFLETKGMMVMDVCEIHDALKKCLLLNRPQQVICKFNFRNLNRHVLSQNESLRERLSTLVEAELKDQLAEEPGTSELSSVHDCVRRTVSNIINISIGELHDDSTLCSLGIDSMLAMTLQNKVFQDTGVNVPLVHILDPTSTTGSLVAFLENSK